ncbi:hypothetical protein K3495_g13358 [Podosphaera aphanis]|nr:hypothetical protein K3495_g13358 [Podosphaera aphanis]
MARQENETPNERHIEEQLCRNAESMTYSDFIKSLRDDFEGCRLQSNNITLGFEEREKDNDIHLDAFLNVGNDKKRARPLDTRDILNDDVQDLKLHEIVGRQEKGPVDFKKLAEDIQVHITLMELFQISPDLSKAFRALSTRVNEKIMKTRMKNELPRPPELSENTISSEALLSKAAGPSTEKHQKAFRLPVLVNVNKNGKIRNIELPLD